MCFKKNKHVLTYTVFSIDLVSWPLNFVCNRRAEEGREVPLENIF